VINLKDLNAHIQYDHFKMEGTHLLRDLLQPQDWLGKIDLKDAYFVIPIWKAQEVSSLCLEEYTPRVCMPSFWAVGGPSTVHKGDETSRCSSSPSRDTSDNIPGRSFVHESIQGRPTTRYGYGTVPLRKFRFCDKFREVVFHANSDIRVSRVSSKHSGYDSAPARLQGGSDKSRLQRPDSTSRGVSQGTISANWEADRLHTGHFPCPLALPSSTTSETPSPSPTQGLRRDYSPIKRSGGGATLVASFT
jgi:hypothetical protein